MSQLGIALSTQPRHGKQIDLMGQSISERLPAHWIERECGCGIGEPHYRYSRDDCGVVCRDHGIKGDNLRVDWIGCGQYSDQQIAPHKTALAAIKKLDGRYPQEQKGT